MKKIILWFSLALFSIVGQAQRELLEPVYLTLNSPDGIYQKGDTVKIYGSLKEPLESPLTLTIFDGGIWCSNREKDPMTSPVELTEKPRLIYQNVFHEAKSIVLSLTADQKTSSRVGFMVAPQEFRPGYEIPKDFVSWWEGQKTNLRRTKPEVKLTPVELKDPQDAAQYEANYIEISMHEGNPVRGYLVKPKGAKPKSLPAAMLLHAAGVSGSWCHASLNDALRYAKKGHGAIVIDFNAHGYPEGKPEEYYKELERNELKGYHARPLVDRESFYFRLMFLREVRALDYICSLPEWDGKRVLVHGESQGGAQAEAIAGLDKRVTHMVANVPAMTDFGAVRNHHQSGWPGEYEKMADTELGKSILPYFDGALFLQFSDAKLFITSGLIDETCYPIGVHAAYNVAKSRHKRICPFPYRWHSGTNKPHNRVWNETIGKEREDFENEALK